MPTLEQEKVNEIVKLSKNKRIAMEEKAEIANVLLGVDKESMKRVNEELIRKYRESSDAQEKRDLGFIIPHIQKEYIENEKKEEPIKPIDDVVLDKDFDTKSRGYDRESMSNIDFEKEGMIFSPAQTKNISYDEILEKYKKDHISHLPIEDQNTIHEIKTQLSQNNKGGKINNKNIIIIPVYAKEESTEGLKKLIDHLSKQQGDFQAIFYVNSYNTDKDDNGKIIKQNETTLDLHKKKVEELKNITAGNNKISIVEHYYPIRKPIGTIRADITDGVISVVDSGVETNLIYIDADAWKLSDNYIKSIEKKLELEDISYCVARLRWTTTAAKEHKFVWFTELLSAFADLLQQDTTTREGISSSGAATSYKLKEYMKVKGMDRSLWKGEDTLMNIKFQQFYNSQKRGAWLNEKIRTDPRRGEKVLMEGKDFHQQWSGNFDPIPSGLDKSKLEKNNNIILSLLSNKLVSDSDRNIIEKYVEDFCKRYEKYLKKGYVENALKKYRNMYYKKDSLYEINVINNKIKFIKK